MEAREKRMNTLTQVVTVLTKLCEIAYDVGATCMAVGLVMFVMDRKLFPGVLVKGTPTPGQTLKIQGFSIVIGNPDGSFNTAAFVLFFVVGGLILALMAWVFRNVNLILRTTQGLTKFSAGKTPFQKENVRMLREIGIFLLAILAIQFLVGNFAIVLVGPGMVETSVSLSNLVFGLLMLCLSHWVDMGARLQEDVDGLV